YIDALRLFDIGLARRIADETVPAFLSGAYDELYIVFNEFRSVASQKPKALQILPVPAVDATGEEPVGKLAYVYEPSEDEILSKLLPAYVVVSIYRGLLETSAGEHGARMVAMDNATKSCQDFIETLTLQFNKARQSSITAELMDIVGGTEALAKAQ
ncbi:MAG: F0F1 ATP synthase subunit gamma, partial [Deltaproteobacteria bacterium]|nr:F0F1 ATP synthase subunit gamma [Deltaproteobacteria bacterium]